MFNRRTSGAEFQKLFLDHVGREKGPNYQGITSYLKREGNDLVEWSAVLQASRIGSPISCMSPPSFTPKFHSSDQFLFCTRQTNVTALRMLRARCGYKDYSSGIVMRQLFLCGPIPLHASFKIRVRLYEHRDAMLHAKTGVIDGVWSTIGLRIWTYGVSWGTMRWMRHSEPGFCGRMEAMFAKDLENSHRSIWCNGRKPLLDRLRERLSRLIQYWLWWPFLSIQGKGWIHAKAQSMFRFSFWRILTLANASCGMAAFFYAHQARDSWSYFWIVLSFFPCIDLWLLDGIVARRLASHSHWGGPWLSGWRCLFGVAPAWLGFTLG